MERWGNSYVSYRSHSSFDQVAGVRLLDIDRQLVFTWNDHDSMRRDQQEGARDGLMYVGRIVAAGKSKAGRNAALYRVSSRSFPNRQAVDLGGTVAILPSEGAEEEVLRNPYISYNALRTAGRWVVVANGSHTDPISEKLKDGMAPMEALGISLLALGYERDQFNTPRIAAVVSLDSDLAWLAIIRSSGLQMESVRLEAGSAIYIATYEADAIRATQTSEFDATSAEQAARLVINGGSFVNLDSPVASAAALAGPGGFELGTAFVG